VAARAEIYQRKDGKTWGWRLIAANERIVATDGSQGYATKAFCESMCKRVIGGEWSKVPVVEVDEATAEAARQAAHSKLSAEARTRY
jgi:uncharacterized protein YegP (UPF0339 family)